MSLQVWLPLNGNLQNKGLANISVVSGIATFKNNGKIGNKCLDLHTCNRFYCQKLANKKEFSFAFWYKPETSESTVNWNDVIYFYDKNEDESVSGSFRLQTSYNNSYILSIHNNPSYNIISNSKGTYGSNLLLSSSTAIRDKWYHVVITLSEDKGLNAYINGELKWIVAHNGGHITGYFNLGQINSSGNEEGSMNDLRIFDHCLSLKEIKELSKGLVLHYPLDNNELGKINPNLLRYQVSSNNWKLWGYGEAFREKIILEDGKTWIHVKQQDTTRYDGYYIAPIDNQIEIDNTKKYTISCLAKAGNKTNAQLIIWWHWRSTEGGANLTQDTKRFVLTSTPTRVFYTIPQYTHTTYNVDRINIMMGSYKSDNEIYFTDVKFEQGTQTTSWIPHINDSEYSTLGYDDTTIYDCSGYQNNGTSNNITYSIYSPRYNASTVFDASNHSWIKINTNNWMSQGMEEMTINFWLKRSTVFPKVMSCTQSGGWNLQAGNSGFARFPINVYTNEAQTTHAYKYDNTELQLSSIPLNEWAMITLIYDNTGTKTYINSKLHHTYSYTSYGIHYNINARLFLGCEASTANPTSPYFAGGLSDFRMYTTALSEEDIKRLYNTSAIADKNNNFYSYSYNEQGYSNELQYFYNWIKRGSYMNNISHEKDGLHLNSNAWITQDFIPINPENKTFKYDITYSVDAGNQFYIGWERYDEDKTTRSNNATVYVIAIKSSIDLKYQHIQGVVNLSTDGVNPCAFIRLRILNNWTGSETDTNGTAIIHSLSLKEYYNDQQFTPVNISKQGIVNTTSFIEKNNINININRTQQLSSNNFYEI